MAVALKDYIAKCVFLQHIVICEPGWSWSMLYFDLLKKQISEALLQLRCP